MEPSNNKEFFDLLKTISSEDVFTSVLSDKKTYTFKQLSTIQLKDLVKSVVDSPLTQSSFNSSTSKIFKDNLVVEGVVNKNNFTIIDRTLFVLDTRINSLSPSYTIKEDNKEPINVNIEAVKAKILETLDNKKQLFVDKTFQTETPNITITYGIPTIRVEEQLNEELYKNVELNLETPEQLRKALGDAFINEIAKTIKTISIQDKFIDLSTTTFKNRLKAVESLPASSIQAVIAYVEEYKKAIEEALTVHENTTLSIDGSLFSIR